MPFGRVAIWRDGERRLPFYICPLMIYQARSSPFSVMAPIAMVIALCCAALPAAADTKPCRTPCLSAAVPRESTPTPPAAAKPTEAEAKPAPVATSRPSARPKPQAVAVAAPPPAPMAQEVEKAAAPKRPPPSRRCTEINMRAAVGEPLSDEDMKILRSQC
ncbi:hypothetical protein GmRootV213_13110 [Variovorax sp. V213]